MKTLLLAIIVVSSLVGCSPEVGSDKWCTMMKEKPKGDWSSNDAKEFAKSCILK